MKYVIIGAGAAGVSAAKTIREIDTNGEVIILGEERFFPYNRYLLTDFLCDSIKENELIHTSASVFKKIGVTFRKGEHVKAIHPWKKCIKLFHNEVVHYDKLLIATGGTPGLGPVLQPFQKHIQRYYSLEDISLLKRKLPHIQKCIVFGEGVSSLDLLCGLCNLEKQVVYIIRGARADWELVEPEFYGELHAFLEEKGIKIITEDRVISIEKSNHCFQVQTLKQRKLTADIVFAWDHYRPNITCIKGTRIEKKLGILVDKQMRTSEEDIYAAGDCVEIYHPGLKNYWINFGWSNAQEQGEVAGKNMAGHRETYHIQKTIVFNLMGKSLRARWWK
jgi:NADPH-dependent 2,4-dienoyl-CoA reductase/sulfur reductase-like enzyme